MPACPAVVIMDTVKTTLRHFWKGSTPAHGLPAAAYTDGDFWEIERRTVFTRNWVCIGFAHEVGKPGEVMPVDFAGHPLVIVRNQGGGLGVRTVRLKST